MITAWTASLSKWTIIKGATESTIFEVKMERKIILNNIEDISFLIKAADCKSIKIETEFTKPQDFYNNLIVIKMGRPEQRKIKKIRVN